MRYFKKLVGDRIYLSPRNSEDVEIFTEWLNDFETTDYIGRSSAIVSLEGEKKYLEEHSRICNCYTRRRQNDRNSFIRKDRSY